MSFTDEEWDEIKQDIPAHDGPFLTKYLQGREALIAQEKKTRSGMFFFSLNNLFAAPN
jgi:adenosine deaminase CECR1